METNKALLDKKFCRHFEISYCRNSETVCDTRLLTPSQILFLGYYVLGTKCVNIEISCSSILHVSVNSGIRLFCLLSIGLF